MKISIVKIKKPTHGVCKYLVPLARPQTEERKPE